MLAVGQIPDASQPVKVRVGSKAFTESVILGEIVALTAERDGYDVEHVAQLGGTRVVWNALITGEIDVYADYTGTIRKEVFTGETLPDDASLRRELAEHGILMTAPLGFNNTYAIGVKEETARRLNLRTISDLKKHTDLRFGFSSEFRDRVDDGWPGLRERYRLPHRSVRGMEHALAYRAMESGDIDVTDVYSTDSAVRRYQLRTLEDNLGFFPRYDAHFLYRRDLVDRAARLVESLLKLEGSIDDARMLSLNENVEIRNRSERLTAAGFLDEQRDDTASSDESEPGLAARVAGRTGEHLLLVLMSLLAAILVAVPLGVIAAKKPVAGQFIVGAAEIVQTIPGLALLIFMAVGFTSLNRFASAAGLPESWHLRTIGAPPVIVALFLYSLLPILRNTMTGIASVPEPLRESAAALGLPASARLWRIELPLASRTILAGIKTTAVINVGYAALGGLIGAGGYGQPIVAGLRRNSETLMMEGAIPAALLALLVKWAFELSERYVVPKGLRLS